MRYLAMFFVFVVIVTTLASCSTVIGWTMNQDLLRWTKPLPKAKNIELPPGS